jgi:hypothetical protein
MRKENAAGRVPKSRKMEIKKIAFLPLLIKVL